MKARLLLAGALAVSGCVEVEDRSTDFEYLHAAIIEPTCATVGCHSRQSQQSPPNTLGLDLSTPTRACAALRDRNDQPPGDVLILYLEGNRNDMVEPIYDQMPPDVPLPSADIELIRAWLDAGAPCE
jgi:hypothetical protein